MKPQPEKAQPKPRASGPARPIPSLTPAEWASSDDTYPSHEAIRCGNRGAKELIISLPLEFWWTRALEWAQGLELMTYVIAQSE